MRLQDQLDLSGFTIHLDQFVDFLQPLSGQEALLDAEMVRITRSVRGEMYSIELGWENEEPENPAFVCTLVRGEAWEHPLSISETPDARLAFLMFGACVKWLSEEA